MTRHDSLLERRCPDVLASNLDVVGFALACVLWADGGRYERVLFAMDQARHSEFNYTGVSCRMSYSVDANKYALTMS